MQTAKIKKFVKQVCTVEEFPRHRHNEIYGIQLSCVNAEQFVKSPFGRRLDDWKKIEEWKKSGAKQDWISTRPRNNERPMAQLKQWIDEVKPSEFFCVWKIDDQYQPDSREIWYMP